jgi:hypothetical protein
MACSRGGERNGPMAAEIQSEANPERPPKASAQKEDIHSSSPMAGPRPRSVWVYE